MGISSNPHSAGFTLSQYVGGVKAGGRHIGFRLWSFKLLGLLFKWLKKGRGFECCKIGLL